MNFFSVNSVLEKLCSFFYWSSYFTLTVISEYKQPLPGLATQYEFETKKLRSKYYHHNNCYHWVLFKSNDRAF